MCTQNECADSITLIYILLQRIIQKEKTKKRVRKNLKQKKINEEFESCLCHRIRKSFRLINQEKRRILKLRLKKIKFKIV